MIAIARTFMTAGRIGHPLYDPDDPLAQNRAVNGRHASIDHFPEKLLRLQSMLNTDTAREIGARRQERMIAFLTDFFDEMELDPSASPHWREWF